MLFFLQRLPINKEKVPPFFVWSSFTFSPASLLGVKNDLELLFLSWNLHIMIDTTKSTLLKPTHYSSYLLPFQDSSATLVSSMDPWYGDEKQASLGLPRQTHYGLHHWKDTLARLTQARNEWYDSRALKRQQRREKRPQDGKTNPFEWK